MVPQSVQEGRWCGFGPQAPVSENESKARTDQFPHSICVDSRLARESTSEDHR
jgi:hypothetical protein